MTSLSGIDCCGKSTQIALLREYLQSRGEKPVVLWVRGGYTPRLVGARALLRRSVGQTVLPAGDTAKRRAYMSNPWRRRLWLHLAILDLFIECAVRIRWLQYGGKTVICDRYLEDTEIDFAIHFPRDNVTRWLSWRVLRRLAVKPQIKFLLDLPYEESRRRSVEKNEPFPDNDELRSLRARYYADARQAGGWTVLDACRPAADLHAEILRQLGLNAAVTAATGETP